MRLLLAPLLSLVAYTAGAEALACAVFNVSTEDTVLVGRNHDWYDDSDVGPYAARYALEFVPGAAGKHGAVFGVARFRGIVAVFEGMNERGLFVGVAAVPKLPVIPSSLPPTTIGALVRLLVEGAATVDEATALARRWHPGFSGDDPNHLMVVDASGASVVLEWVDGALRVVAKQGRAQHMANAYLSPAEPGVVPAWATDGRYERIRAQLDGGGGTTVDGAFAVLASVAQTSPGIHTQTSFVHDLRARTSTLVFQRAHDRRFGFRLDEELAKGVHTIVARELAGGAAPAAPAAQGAAEPLVFGRYGELFRQEPGRAGGVQLTALGYDISLGCAPDGRISFSRFVYFDPTGPAGSRLAAYVIGRSGDVRQLTDGTRGDIFTVWPRSGGDELYLGRIDQRLGKKLVYRTSATASPGDEVLVSDPAHDERVFGAMRDGRLVVESDREGGFHLFALRPARDGAPAAYQRIRTAFPVEGRFDKVTISPDEKQILFELGPGDGMFLQGRAQAHRARFDARTLTISAPKPIGTSIDGVFTARWGKDGRSIYYLSNRTGRNHVYRHDLRTGAARRVTADDLPHDGYCVPGAPH